MSTPTEYLKQVREHEQKLRSFVSVWHPASRAKRPKLRITAKAAEAACAGIRNEIAAEGVLVLTPAERFDKALREGNAREIDDLLNSAWFGVPESTECWNIEGFSQAVDLMGDPPYDEEEEEDESQPQPQPPTQ